ncbi:MAG: RNA 2',3'-cyclic phosphodiesterase [Spirochaetes bacterium]|nr:RNA 2',3'-cyclic phosphodiesterase [Spirochaetota bacterium]
MAFINEDKETGQKRLTRIFIAIDLPDQVKDEIENSYKNISSDKKIRIRWIPKKNLHMTLKFLGAVSEKQIEKICETLKDLKLNMDSELFTHSYGLFPLKGIPKIFWVSFKENNKNELSDLFEMIEQSLEPLGFQKEKRRFVPHVTIARLKISGNSELKDFHRVMERYNEKFKSISKQSFPVKKITLFKSELQPGGAVYSKIMEF